MAKKARPWPKYSTALRNGNRRLQWPDSETGKLVSITTVLPNEPKGGYATPAEWWSAHERFMAALTERVDRSETVLGFSERWSDPETSLWRRGMIGGKRSESTLLTNGLRVQKFVRMYGGYKMAAIGEREVEAYLATDPPRSSLAALAQMFRDGTSKRGGRVFLGENPFAEYAKEVDIEDRERRDEIGILTPEDHEIETLLYTAWRKPYPRSFAAWLEMGTETGMRTGELDAMRFDHVVALEDGSPGYYVEEQFNQRTSTFTRPKWNSRRTIPLSSGAVGIIDLMRTESLGSPFVFNTQANAHYNQGARNYWWNGRGDLVGLRSFVGGQQMKNATRHFFTTQMMREHNRAMRAGEPAVPIRLLAEHLGHKDDGATLSRFYAKTYEQDMHAAMRDAMRSRERRVDELARRRRAA